MATRNRRPRTLSSILGPIEVAFVDVLRTDAGKRIKGALGKFSGRLRIISVLKGLHPAQEAHTLEHEWAHVVLWDSGLTHFLSHEKTEALCDAFASALVKRLHE